MDLLKYSSILRAKCSTFLVRHSKNLDFNQVHSIYFTFSFVDVFGMVPFWHFNFYIISFRAINVLNNQNSLNRKFNRIVNYKNETYK